MIRFARHQLAVLATAGLLAGSAFAGGEGWTNDFAAAQETAETEGKDMLLDFTGSDWCGWCIKLKEEVFSQDTFQAYAPEHFVLVELDFPTPRVAQSDELKAQNAALKEKYPIRGYPTILLIDASGMPFGQTGYKAGGPEAYVEHLEEFRAAKIIRDEHFAAAEQAQGIERAQHIHAALQAIGDDLAVAYYEPFIQEVMELDSDNAEGIKQHYQDVYTTIQQNEEFMAVLRENRRDPQAAVAAIDEFLTREGLLLPVRQSAMMYKTRYQLSMFRRTLDESIALDPESDIAKYLIEMKDSMFPPPPKEEDAEGEAEVQN